MNEPDNQAAAELAASAAPTYWVPPADTISPEPRRPRSGRLRSRVAIATLAVAGVLGLIASIQDIGGLGVIDRAEAGTLTVAEAEEFDSTFSSMGVLQTAAFVLAAIAYLAWLSRSVDNVPGLGGGKPVATPAWSIGWWFIPFANLFKPYQVVVDLYRRMAPVERIGTGLVLAWWVLWILNTFAGEIARRLQGSDELGTLRTSLQFWAVTDFGDLVTAALAILVVLRIQGWADARENAPTTSSIEDPQQPEPQPLAAG